MANKQLPEVLAKMVLENSAIPSNTPKPLQLFANNQTWDPNFVVAPPSSITAQNMYAQARGVSGSWDPIKSIPYIVKDSRDATNKGYVETTKDLRIGNRIIGLKIWRTNCAIMRKLKWKI